MNNQIISAADIMMQVANIGTSEANEICSVWKKVVSGVKSYKHDGEDSEKRMPLGERLAGNTRVIDLKNGVLLVETDHPGWIQYLRIYQKYILTGLKMNLPDLKITNLAFRVAGEKVNLSEAYNQELAKSRKQQAEFLEKQEKALSKIAPAAASSDNKNKSELPPELLAKLNSIKQSIAADENDSK